MYILLIGGFTSILFRFYSLTLYFLKEKNKIIIFESTSKNKIGKASVFVRMN